VYEINMTDMGFFINYNHKAVTGCIKPVICLENGSEIIPKFKSIEETKKSNGEKDISLELLEDDKGVSLQLNCETNNNVVIMINKKHTQDNKLVYFNYFKDLIRYLQIIVMRN
jgi:hypothetical protein